MGHDCKPGLQALMLCGPANCAEVVGFAFLPALNRRPTTDAADPQSTPVLAFELIGTRFLRRMVRVLVATAVREALPQAAWFSSSCVDTCGGSAAGSSCAVAGAAATAEPGGHDKGCLVAGAAEAAAEAAAGWDAGGLLRAAASKDRQVTAAPARAEGLLFLEAGYSPLPV